MSCPRHIIEPLTEILRIGLLNIRISAGYGDAHRCYVEANHIHNIPSLIRNYKQELLQYYIDVEKPSFERDSVGVDLQLFEQQWTKLRS
jgi:hypothetical protein